MLLGKEKYLVQKEQQLVEEVTRRECLEGRVAELDRQKDLVEKLVIEHGDQLEVMMSDLQAKEREWLTRSEQFVTEGRVATVEEFRSSPAYQVTIDEVMLRFYASGINHALCMAMSSLPGLALEEMAQ